MVAGVQFNRPAWMRALRQQRRFKLDLLSTTPGGDIVLSTADHSTGDNVTTGASMPARATPDTGSPWIRVWAWGLPSRGPAGKPLYGPPCDRAVRLSRLPPTCGALLSWPAAPERSACPPAWDHSGRSRAARGSGPSARS